jgi:polysaccharide export outer membrane protein
MKPKPALFNLPVLAALSAMRPRLALLALLAFAPVAASAAPSEYPLDVGDVLEITAVSVPSLRQRVTVAPNGMVSFPFVGELQAAGTVLSDLRQQLREKISARDIRLVGSDGREIRTAIAADEIGLEVAEYRPVLLSGDVARPGQQPFQPGMTVRRALAAAGGIDPRRVRIGNPFLEAPELQSQYENLRAELVRQQARAQSAQAELDGKDSLNRSELLGANADNALYARVAELEAQQLALRVADFRAQQTYLQNALRQTDAKIAALRRLAASPRGLEANVQIAQARIDRDEIERRLQAFEMQKKMDLLRTLQEATLKIADLRTQIQSVGDRLLYTGSVTSQGSRQQDQKLAVTIYRKGENNGGPIVADESSELMPGDLAEIVVQAEGLEPR